VLFLTPGPVWAAMIARSLSHGMRAAWPLALGVAIGDMIWPLLAIYGTQKLLLIHTDMLSWLTIIAAMVFMVIGITTITKRKPALDINESTGRADRWSSFIAGLLVIMSNPKAIFFYMGILPGFFALGDLMPVDIAIILAISAAVPFIGNLGLATAAELVRTSVRKPSIVRTIQLITGTLLIVISCTILLSLLWNAG
ncbi:MAG: LysE family translocator, partial [Pseudomonadota bacterium]